MNAVGRSETDEIRAAIDGTRTDAGIRSRLSLWSRDETLFIIREPAWPPRIRFSFINPFIEYCRHRILLKDRRDDN